MVDLSLETDEEIIRQTTDVERYRANDDYAEINELYLTNKNLIYIYEKSNGIFSKNENIMEKTSLNDIRVVNGKVQIFEIDDDDYGLGLQILINNGSREHLVFEKKKELQAWYNSIIEVITGEKNIETQSTNHTISYIEDNSSILLSNFKNVVDSAKGKINNIKKQVVDELLNDQHIDKINEKSPNDIKKETNNIINNTTEKDITLKKKQIESNIIKENPHTNNECKEKNRSYCSNCGKELTSNSKFCSFCGSPVDNIKINNNTIQEIRKNNIENKKEELSERKIIYEGKIHKCPNCGEPLDSFVTNCPACGYELRDAKSSSAVNELAHKLEELELNRENNKITNKILQNINMIPLTKTDEQKISLIKNFHIPNTKEDLYEFLILSKSNIEIDLYEDSPMQAARLAISDAWKVKFEQAYYKAKILFKNDERFSEIQSMYDETITAINKAKNKSKNKEKMGFLGLGIMAILGIGLSLGLLSYTADNNSNSPNQSQTEIQKNNENYSNKVVNINNNNFDADAISKELKVKQYKYEEYNTTYTAFVIENPTNYDLDINVEVKFYNKDGSIVAAKDGSIPAVERKSNTFIWFHSDSYDNLDYKITVAEETYFRCVTSSLTYNSVKSKDKEIVSLTNNGDFDAKFVEGYALFFKNNKLVDISFDYFENDGVLKPKQTITKELECSGEYDSVQFYFVGNADK